MAGAFAGVRARAGIGGASGAPDVSPGATTIPGGGQVSGGMQNPKVIYIWAGAILVLFLFHVGGASIGG